MTEQPNYRKKVLFDEIDKLSKLKEDWDGYGAPPISEDAMKAAKEFVALFEAIPTSGGGIVFEVHFGDGFEVSVGFAPDGTICSCWTSWEGPYG